MSDQCRTRRLRHPPASDSKLVGLTIDRWLDWTQPFRVFLKSEPRRLRISTVHSRDPMLKIVLCIKRKPGMTREAFHSYWKNEHSKVMQEVAGAMGIRRNVHNRTYSTDLDERIRTNRGAPQEDFDGVAESW